MEAIRYRPGGNAVPSRACAETSVAWPASGAVHDVPSSDVRSVLHHPTATRRASSAATPVRPQLHAPPEDPVQATASGDETIVP